MKPRAPPLLHSSRSEHLSLEGEKKNQTHRQHGGIEREVESRKQGHCTLDSPHCREHTKSTSETVGGWQGEGNRTKHTGEKGSRVKAEVEASSSGRHEDGFYYSSVYKLRNAQN